LVVEESQGQNNKRFYRRHFKDLPPETLKGHLDVLLEDFFEMIIITPTIKIKEDEIKFDFIRASGPGGQKVNKVSTAVHLRFDVKNSPALSEDIRSRLVKLAGKRITEDGILIIKAKSFRTQKQNRKNAVNRLIKLIQKADEKPKIRIKTKPSPASKKRVIEAKKHQAEKKKLRRSVSIHND